MPRFEVLLTCPHCGSSAPQKVTTNTTSSLTCKQCRKRFKAKGGRKVGEISFVKA